MSSTRIPFTARDYLDVLTPGLAEIGATIIATAYSFVLAYQQRFIMLWGEHQQEHPGATLLEFHSWVRDKEKAEVSKTVNET